MNYQNLLHIDNVVAPDNKGIVYLYSFDNGKQYVGQTRISVKKRYVQHFSNNDLLANIMKKHRHAVSVLEIVDIDKLDEAEIFWIKTLNTVWPFGYNFTYGGEHTVFSEATLDKLSEQKTGDKNPQFGKRGKYSSVSKPVYQYSKDGKFINEYESMSLAQEATGISFKSISVCCMGKTDKNGYVTKTAGGFMWKYADGDKSDIEPVKYNYSKDTSHMTNRTSKAVIATNVHTGEEVRFNSACEAQRKIGVSQANISSCLKGTRKMAGDYTWRLADD